MNADTELEVWRRQWQSDTIVPTDLRKMVERQSRWMRIDLIAAAVVTVGIGGATAAWAFREPQPSIILLAVWTWILIAVAWAFRIRVNRGNWSPSAESAAVFVDLSVRRCQAKLSAIRFASGFFVVQIVFVLGWVYKNTPGPSTPLWSWLFFSSVPIDAVWLCTGAFFGFQIWYRRRKRVELAYFLSLREDHPAHSI